MRKKLAEKMSNDYEDDDKNRAEEIWIYDNPDSFFLGDRCYTCGVAQDSDTLIGTYSRHTRDCEYAPIGAWVSGSLQRDLDSQRLSDLRKDAALNHQLEKEQERVIAESRNKPQKPTSAMTFDSPNTIAMKDFGLSFAKLMTNFDAERAKSEITRYETWLEKYPGSEDPDPYWIHFLNNYASNLRTKINNPDK